MNVLYLVKQTPDATLKKIMEVQRKEHQVTMVDLRENKDYGKMIDLIFLSDLVISW